MKQDKNLPARLDKPQLPAKQSSTSLRTRLASLPIFMGGESPPWGYVNGAALAMVLIAVVSIPLAVATYSWPALLLGITCVGLIQPAASIRYQSIASDASADKAIPLLEQQKDEVVTELAKLITEPDIVATAWRDNPKLIAISKELVKEWDQRIKEAGLGQVCKVWKSDLDYHVEKYPPGALELAAEAFRARRYKVDIPYKDVYLYYKISITPPPKQ